jgi:hypothetical protein
VEDEKIELWWKFCEQAANEQDPEKLFALRRRFIDCWKKRKQGSRKKEWRRLNGLCSCALCDRRQI